MYRKFNLIPNQYIIKTLYRNVYQKKLSYIIKEYGPIQNQINYSFIDENLTKYLESLKKEKEWFQYYDELNTILYQHDDMNILQSTGMVLINREDNYLFFNNTFTKWYPSTKVLTINLEDVFNEYERLKIDSFYESKN